MSIISLLPVLVVVIFIVLVLMGIGLLLKKVTIWRPKHTLFISIAYFSIALISVIGIVVLQDKAVKFPSEQVLQKQIEFNNKLSNEIELRNYENLERSLLKFSKTIEVNTPDLEVVRGDNSFDTRIVIEWNDSKSNEIVASYYETPLYYDGINLSDKVQQPIVELRDEKLYIENPTTFVKVQSLRMTMYQFQNQGPHQDFIGLRILHLNVPRHFNIIDNSGWSY
ncbi:MAG: hypothetical protein ABS944_13960 [Solibacillus sp.]|uniref:hypothetical protein n=1 Tax=unclassified Solibacillus TaxID=2637870 RepID=UPI0030F4BABC